MKSLIEMCVCVCGLTLTATINNIIVIIIRFNLRVTWKKHASLNYYINLWIILWVIFCKIIFLVVDWSSLEVSSLDASIIPLKTHLNGTSFAKLIFYLILLKTWSRWFTDMIFSLIIQFFIWFKVQKKGLL